jgi:cytochrome c
MTTHQTLLTAMIMFGLTIPVGITLPAMATAQSKPDGAALYQAKCGGCHSIATNRIGPAHKGVYGRKAGMAPGYKYSPALKTSGIVWNDQTLDKWLQGPPKVVKGTKMFFTVADPAQRAAIIAYLKSPAAR